MILLRFGRATPTGTRGAAPRAPYSIFRKKKLRTFALVICAGLSVQPGFAVAESQCDPIMPGVSYCSDIPQRQSGYGRTVYPDLVGGYVLQRAPVFVSSRVIVMPYDRPIESPDDIVRMMLDQLMRRGTAPVAGIAQIEVAASVVAGVASERARFSGTHADGGVIGRFVVEMVPRPSALLLLYTHVEGTRAGATSLDELEALHQASVGYLEILPE